MIATKGSRREQMKSEEADRKQRAEAYAKKMGKGAWAGFKYVQTGPAKFQVVDERKSPMQCRRWRAKNKEKLAKYMRDYRARVRATRETPSAQAAGHAR